MNIRTYLTMASCKTITSRTLRIKAVVAERLRRWTRNPMGSPRAGSNPADCETHFALFSISRFANNNIYIYVA